MAMPTKYTPELVERICERIAEGETLSDICRGDGMPNRRTFYDWLEKDDKLGEAGKGKGHSARFAHAREVGFDEIAEDCLRIADDNTRDVKEIDMGDGIKVQSVDYEVIQRSKLRVETRLKLLAKWNPKKYGDKVELGGNINLTNSPITFE